MFSLFLLSPLSAWCLYSFAAALYFPWLTHLHLMWSLHLTLYICSFHLITFLLILQLNYLLYFLLLCLSMTLLCFSSCFPFVLLSVFINVFLIFIRCSCRPWFPTPQPCTLTVRHYLLVNTYNPLWDFHIRCDIWL